LATLSDEIQAFIVQAHACFRKPALIVRDVKTEFDVVVTRQQVQFYHPERGGDRRKKAAEKWRLLFAETRKAFVEGKVEVGIAKQTYRLQLYQRAAEFYEQKGNMVLAAEMAEKAAKEEGGAYTNRRELTGQGGTPLVPEVLVSALAKAYGDPRDSTTSPDSAE
jgi:hypothetical protein